MPWLGYFEQMAYADHFVFYDDVQYTRQDWRNRNRILTKSGPIWLTVPVVRTGLKTLINEVRINNSTNWAAKHLKSIVMNYSKASYFNVLIDDVCRVLSKKWDKLLDLDVELTKILARHFDIVTPTSFSSEVPRDPESYAKQYGRDSSIKEFERNMRVIEVCRHHEANVFYEGARGADYIDTDLFRQFGIEVVFQDYRHAVYPQFNKVFHSHISAIDLLMNTGPRAREILLSSPSPFAFS